jgi:hypothetical protein
LLECVGPIDFQEKAEYSTENYDTTKRETSYILCENAYAFSVPIGDGGNPSPSGEVETLRNGRPTLGDISLMALE